MVIDNRAKCQGCAPCAVVVSKRRRSFGSVSENGKPHETGRTGSNDADRSRLSSLYHANRSVVRREYRDDPSFYRSIKT